MRTVWVVRVPPVSPDGVSFTCRVNVPEGVASCAVIPAGVICTDPVEFLDTIAPADTIFAANVLISAFWVISSDVTRD